MIILALPRFFDTDPILTVLTGRVAGGPGPSRYQLVDAAGKVVLRALVRWFTGHSTITVSLNIINTYQFYPTVAVTVTDARIGRPPLWRPPITDVEIRALDDWAYEHIYPFTGVGHTDGDSWYDVTIIASSLPWLTGYTFNWGY
ncbi:hypothetical protein [Paractinoplanes rishiriensis]|uniref:Uncharacterized protein n=1 Tax=Paractinoplanes rishiriensis TaxID=1050105 RepID=A0A919N025_9ACTN|nr:hypothetical protein [Actinoplanes rishiriensis]GIF02010.1 hypothetical protein Ari01nite_94740 [Actinoplanes rishiriensis]